MITTIMVVHLVVMEDRPAVMEDHLSVMVVAVEMIHIVVRL